MPDDQTPLFVRLSADPNRRLENAVAVSGKTKRQLVEDAVRDHLNDDGLVVGHVALREEVPEVLTLEDAAVLLRVETAALEEAAQRNEIPGRRIATEWRFSKAALMSWLGSEQAQAS